MNSIIGVVAFIFMAVMGSFLLALLIGFRQRSPAGTILNSWRSRGLKAIPLAGYPRFFLMILVIAPLGMGISILGPMLLLQAVLPAGSAHQLPWDARTYMFVVVILASIIREL